MSEVKYRAVVCHGGELRGLGVWKRGRRWRDRERAEREGQRIAAKCKQVVGGLPEVIIEEGG